MKCLSWSACPAAISSWSIGSYNFQDLFAVDSKMLILVLISSWYEETLGLMLCKHYGSCRHPYISVSTWFHPMRSSGNDRWGKRPPWCDPCFLGIDLPYILPQYLFHLSFSRGVHYGLGGKFVMWGHYCWTMSSPMVLLSFFMFYCCYFCRRFKYLV